MNSQVQLCAHACEDPSDPMIEVWEHALRLGKTIEDFAAHRPGSDGWEHTGAFLQLTGKLMKVEIVSGLHNTAHFMCSRSAEYDAQRSAVVSQFATDLTRFLFVFNSLDDACTVAGVSERWFRRGVGKKVDELIQSLSLPALKHYKCTIDALLCNASVQYGSSDVAVLSSMVGDGSIGAGSRLAFGFRNKIIHDAFRFPNENLEDKTLQAILRGTTRLALFTIQALAIGLLQPLSVVANLDRDRITTLALETIHLCRYEEDSEN